jgi:micrococcal nuclease
VIRQASHLVSRALAVLVIGLSLAACGATGVADGEPETGVLTIRSHDDGQVVHKERIRIKGSAPPGAEIVRDISLAPDDRTTANPGGKWSMAVELDRGENELTFRIGDADETAITIDVTYEPRDNAGNGRDSGGRNDEAREPAALGEAPRGRTQLATVVSVTDGDTIRVSIDGRDERVRYIGIDAPEAGGQWMASEATRANANLVAGKVVVLERDVSKRDQYGRLLRYVWLETDDGWLLINRELVRRGFAEAVSYPPDVRYDAILLRAQGNAAEAARGVWAPPPLTPAPTPLTLVPQAPAGNCEPSYPDICVQLGLPDLDCGDMSVSGFRVRWDVVSPDPHQFDGDSDGIGCES